MLSIKCIFYNSACTTFRKVFLIFFHYFSGSRKVITSVILPLKITSHSIPFMCSNKHTYSDYLWQSSGKEVKYNAFKVSQKRRSFPPISTCEGGVSNPAGHNPCFT